MNPNFKPVIQRLRKGLGAQGVGQAVNLLIRLAEVPLLLSFWDAERYGEWLMVAAVPSYLAMADGGFTGTTQREMTMRMGAGDRQGALAAFQSTWVMLLVLSSILMGLTSLATAYLPLDQWLKLSSIQGETLTVVILLLTAHIVLGFQCGLAYGGYSCVGRYGRGTNLATLMYLLDFAGLTLAVMLGGGPVAAAGGFLAGRGIALMIFLLDLPNVAPWLHFGWQHASILQIGGLLRPSLASMAFPLGGALNVQGMRLVVGFVLGPVAVAAFSTIRTLCRSAMQPIVVVARLIEPEMALAYGANNYDIIRKLFIRSSQVTLWAAFSGCLILWFLGETLLGWWARNQLTLDTLLYAFLLMASATNSLWFTALMVPFATNRHERVAFFFLLINSGMLLLAIGFMAWLGLAGAGVAVLLTEMAMVGAILPTAFRLSDVTFGNWLEQVVKLPKFLFAILRRNSTGLL